MDKDKDAGLKNCEFFGNDLLWVRTIYLAFLSQVDRKFFSGRGS